MKQTKRLLALLLATLMLVGLTGCDAKQTFQDSLYKLLVMVGVAEEGNEEDDVDTNVYATAGGSIVFPEGMDTTGRVSNQVVDGTLYIAFNGIANRSSDYFVAAGNSVTLTAYATSDAPAGVATSITKFKLALWELSDDQSTTTYVQGTTVYFDFDGTCQTKTVTGLTPGKLYKVYISYDSSKYYITGGATVSGVSSDVLTNMDEE